MLIGWCVMLGIVIVLFLSCSDIETGIPVLDGVSYWVGAILGLCILITFIVAPLSRVWEELQRRDRDWGKVILLLVGFLIPVLFVVALIRGYVVS